MATSIILNVYNNDILTNLIDTNKNTIYPIVF